MISKKKISSNVFFKLTCLSILFITLIFAGNLLLGRSIKTKYWNHFTSLDSRYIPDSNSSVYVISFRNQDSKFTLGQRILHSWGESTREGVLRDVTESFLDKDYNDSNIMAVKVEGNVSGILVVTGGGDLPVWKPHDGSYQTADYTDSANLTKNATHYFYINDSGQLVPTNSIELISNAGDVV